MTALGHDENPSVEPRRTDAAWRQWLVPGILGILFLGFAALRPPGTCGSGACPLPAPAPGAGELGAGEETIRQLIADTTGKIAVLYLHGTIRCETCLEIERIAEQTVRESFAEALAAGTLSWQSIDYDLPENEHYERRFKPPCPSLVLASVLADGQFGHHEILGRTWELIHDDPEAVAVYVRNELQGFIDENRAVGNVSTAGE